MAIASFKQHKRRLKKKKRVEWIIFVIREFHGQFIVLFTLFICDTMVFSLFCVSSWCADEIWTFFCFVQCVMCIVEYCKITDTEIRIKVKCQWIIRCFWTWHFWFFTLLTKKNCFRPKQVLNSIKWLINRIRSKQSQLIICSLMA